MAKKGCLGCSFPVAIGISIFLLALIVIGLLSGALGQALIGETGLGELFALEKPHIQLPAETVFHVFGFGVTNTLLASWLSIIVLVGIAYSLIQCLLVVIVMPDFVLCKFVTAETGCARHGDLPKTTLFD